MVSHTVLFGLLATLAASVSAAPAGGLDLSHARREIPGVGTTYNRMAVARALPAPRNLQARQGCTHGAWACDGSKLTVCQDGTPVVIQDCAASQLTCQVTGHTGCVSGGSVAPPVNKPVTSAAPPVKPATSVAPVVPATSAPAPPVAVTSDAAPAPAITTSGIFDPTLDECLDEPESSVVPDATETPVVPDVTETPVVPDVTETSVVPDVTEAPAPEPTETDDGDCIDEPEYDDTTDVAPPVNTEAPAPVTSDAPAPVTSDAPPPATTDVIPEGGYGADVGGARGGPKGIAQSPYSIVYTMLQDLPADPAELGPINMINLAFWTTKDGSAMGAKSFLDRPDKQAVLDAYHAANKVILLALFGQGDDPTGQDPVGMAATVAQVVKDNGLDGVDVDLEEGLEQGKGGAQWAIAFTKALRQQLGPDHFISHAPQGPYFTSPNWEYMQIVEAAGDDIDLYNIQYYNQGPGNYETCDQLLVKEPNFPGSTIGELAAAGIPMEKLVLGKVMEKTDAGEGAAGYMTADALAECHKQGVATGWPGSIMFWQLHEPKYSGEFYKTIQGLA